MYAPVPATVCQSKKFVRSLEPKNLVLIAGFMMFKERAVYEIYNEVDY